MAPEISWAKLTLTYPAYCCDFDPQDANRLIVGGGGGSGRSGVGNKISVLDTSSSLATEVASEVELSREEDSVTTLAAGLRKNRTLLVYTGINSSVQDVEKGRNEHFRVFGIDPPSRSRSNSVPKITELSKSTIFNSKDADTYQRLLRLAPSYNGTHQVGAIATGLSKTSEIVVFDVSTVAGVGPKTRGKLELTKEAMDLDVMQVDEDKWQLAYCDDYELHLLDIAKGASEGPACAFTMPHDIATGQDRPQFRCIRYLTSNFIMAASNLSKGSGVVLQGFRLPVSTEHGGKARLSVSAKLPKSVTRATCLAVRNLSPTAAPAAKQGDTQFVIAVAGQDSSITLYTLEHQAAANINLLINLYPITTIKSVHPSPISGLAFSYIPPPLPARTVTVSPTTTAPRQTSVKLASVGSMGNTVVVHHLPLKRLSTASPRKGAPPRPPRYVMALKSRGPSPTALILVSALVFALLGALLQGVLEVKGLTHPAIGARRVVPGGWLTPLPSHVSGSIKDTDTVGTGAGFLAEFLAEQKLSLGDEGEGLAGGKVVLSPVDADADGKPDGVKVDAHDEEAHGDAKQWDELPPAQKRAWKEKLKKAGHWGEEMGETIFKGVLFAEIGGAIGQMVAG